MKKVFADLLRKIKPASTQKNIIITAYAATSQLVKVAAKTKTILDDLAILSLHEAIEEVAEELNITLP
jgi:hypothetical protein